MAVFGRDGTGERVWILVLNDMRSSRFEQLTPAARASTREQLVDLMDEERVPSYKDGSWGKSFREGGPLEWFNQPDQYRFDAHLVDYTEVLEQALMRTLALPDVPAIREARAEAVRQVLES